MRFGEILKLRCDIDFASGLFTIEAMHTPSRCSLQPTDLMSVDLD